MKPIRLIFNIYRTLRKKPIVQSVEIYMKSGNVIVIDNVIGDITYTYQGNQITYLKVKQAPGHNVAIESIDLSQIEGFKSKAY